MRNWQLTLLSVCLAGAITACDQDRTSDVDDGPAESLGRSVDQSVANAKQEASEFAASSEEYRGEIRDAWIDGKVEAAFALNRHLNPLTIDTRVENGIVRLEGDVESEIDRNLAGEIAMNVEGVTDVANNLQVRDDSTAAQQANEPRESGTEEFRQAVDDLTTTAAIKSKLLANENTAGLQIDVDTQDGVVTLSGTVDSSEEKDLAESIASNARYVEQVNNQLVISSS